MPTVINTQSLRSHIYIYIYIYTYSWRYKGGCSGNRN